MIKKNTVQVLEDRGVDQGRILFLTLIAAPAGIHHICSRFPRLKLITTEIDEGVDPDTFHVLPGQHRTRLTTGFVPFSQVLSALEVPKHSLCVAWRVASLLRHGTSRGLGVQGAARAWHCGLASQEGGAAGGAPDAQTVVC